MALIVNDILHPEELTKALIMIVDDHEGSAGTLADILESEGFSTQVVSDGASALAQIASSAPDLVLLDLMMPGINGIDVLQKLRADPQTADLPVIIQTALDSPNDVLYGLELGASDYLTKPIQPEILVARLRTQLKIKRLQDERERTIQEMGDLVTIKDRFLQIAAHDLKNPLNNLVIGIELLDQTPVEARSGIQDFDMLIGLMRGSASIMQVLISDFLDLQAMQAGQLKLDMGPVQANDVMHTVLAQFEPYAVNKNILLTPELEEDLPTCHGDAARILQVISNLVSNAIKFSPQGSEIKLRTHSASGLVRMEVVDQGPGIGSEEQHHLFEEFTRLGNRPTGKEKSTGLGLWIARQLVERQGGQIGADSKAGSGSTFWVELAQSQ